MIEISNGEATISMEVEKSDEVQKGTSKRKLEGKVLPQTEEEDHS